MHSGLDNIPRFPLLDTMGVVVGVRILTEARSEEVARKPGKNKEVMKKKGYGKKKKVRS